MPNWTYNTIKVEAKTREQEVIKLLEELTLNENREFTFKKILPQPKDLMLVSGTNLSWAKRYIEALKDGDTTTAKEIKEYFLGKDSNTTVEELYIELNDPNRYNRITPLTEKDFEAYIERIKSNIKTYGYSDWYDWSIANWGTKWDACSPVFEIDGSVVTITFDTAWAAPFPAIQKIYDKMVEHLGDNEEGKIFDFCHRFENEGCDEYGIRNYEYEDEYNYFQIDNECDEF